MPQHAYPTIAAAAESTRRMRAQLVAAVEEAAIPEGCCVAVFGSFGRDEFLSHSDLDWTLLVRTDSDEVGSAWRARFSAIVRDIGIPEPKAGGAFAGVTVDYDLWRSIGTKTDNRDALSKRMLLLLECTPIGHQSVFDNTVDQILRRYRQNESLVPGHTYVVARYLLNDILLFWRMMITDYATASRGPGWGLRALKMGMSRKLLFISGVLWAIAARLDTWDSQDPKILNDEVYKRLRDTRGETPLTRAKQYFTKWASHDGASPDPLFHYDRLLRALHDRAFRHKLERYGYERIREDSDFLEAWDDIRKFHRAVIDILFGRDTWMRDFLQLGAFV